MKTIIVPIDFSATSGSALRLGVYLAELLQLQLQALHVTDLALSGAHSLMTPEQQRKEKELKENLAEFIHQHLTLEEEGNKAPSLSHSEVNTTLLTGAAARQIINLSEKEDTALIIMGGVGKGADKYAPGVYGSVAKSVAARVASPVIFLPKAYTISTIARIAIAFDRAEEVAQLHKFLHKIIQALMPEVRYVHVSAAAWREEVVNREDFVALTKGPDFPAYPFSLDVLPTGNVAEVLLAYLHDQEIGMLVLSRKHHNFWRQLVQQQHLKPILQVANVPVLILPATGKYT